MALVTKNIAQGKESTWGTGVSATAYPRVRTFELNKDMGTKVVDDTGNTFKGFTKMVNLQKAVEGDATFYAYPDDIAHWLRYTLGDPVSAATADVSGNVYAHTFSQTLTLPSFTCLVDKGVQTDRYLGVRGASFKLNAGTDIVEGSVSLHAKDQDSTSSYTPSETELDPFTFDHFAFAFGNDLSTAQAASATPVDEWELEYDLDPEKRYQSGSKLAQRFDPKIAMLKGSMKFYYDANTWDGYYENGTEQALYLTLTDPDTTIGTSGNYKVEFNIPRVQATSNERPYEANNIIVETVNWEAMYSPTETYMLEAIVTNLTAAYTT